MSSGHDQSGEPLRGEALSGGNSNAPVRRGDRVHRLAGPWTPTVHALLRHVRARGVDWVPEPFGEDGLGREVLSFLPGDVPAYPMPQEVWSDALMVDAARMLRAFHDATLDFGTADRIWQRPASAPAEVVCHNDFAPYNFVLDEGRIIGVLDVDMASPGPRAWDLAYLAYRLVPLTADGNDDAPASGVPERRRRLRLLCEAYGTVAPEVVLRTAPERLLELATFSDERAVTLPRLAVHARLYRDDAAWIVEHRAALLA